MVSRATVSPCVASLVPAQWGGGPLAFTQLDVGVIVGEVRVSTWVPSLSGIFV